MTTLKNIYVSYAWKDREEKIEDSREEIVNKLCDAFKTKGYRIIRDKTHMNYRDVIREFMNDIAGASVLIAVISDKYLTSPYCMYELTAAWDRGDFRNRIFPIVLPGVNIYDDLKQIQLTEYWKKEYDQYKEAIKAFDDAAKEGFLQKLRDREYIYQRVSGAIATISGMVGISSNLLFQGNFEEIIRQVEKKNGNITPVNTIAKSKEQESTLRTKFIDKLEQRYNDRLEQKLDDRLSLELDFYEVNEKKEDHVRFFQEIRTIKQEQEKLASLSQKYRFILILGNPGSGKSSRLLDLAKGLLEKAKFDPSAGIPTIFNLAAWNETHTDFEEWLAKMLVDFYAYPKESARSAIIENKIIPLLDGFDEVGAHLDTPEQRNQLRNKCLSTITDYQNQKYAPKQFVICSRIDEYIQAGGDAPVDLKIIVNEVDPDRVIATLENAKLKTDEAYKNANENVSKNLLALIGQYPALKTVLQTPFFFNAAMQTFHQRGDNNLKLPDTEDELKQFIVKEFVERKISNESNKPNHEYDEVKTKAYLNWLAIWLKKQQNVSFELAWFQPQNLNKPRIYGLIYGLILGIIFFLVFVLFFDLFYSLIYSLWLGISLGFILFGGREQKINTEEIRVYKWSKLIKYSLIKEILVSALVFMVFILVTVLVDSLVDNLIDGLIDGGIRILVVSIVFGWFFGIVYGLHKLASEIEYFTTIEKPYRRLNSNIRRDAAIAAFLAVIAFFLFDYLFQDVEVLTSTQYAKLFGVLMGVIYFLRRSPILKHFILAFLLQCENKAPFRMAKFYDYCASLRLLEKDGGTWRFRHQIIHDYFIAEAGKENLKSKIKSERSA